MCTQQITMYTILCTELASTYHQAGVYNMTIAHHWNSEEQTIPTGYGRAVGELIRRSYALETPPYLAHAESNSTGCTTQIAGIAHALMQSIDLCMSPQKHSETY